MTLNQALAIVNSRKAGPILGSYYLACGFEPLHLATFFGANLMERLPGEGNIDVLKGSYGDLRGSLDSAAGSAAAATAAAMEWSDIDPRLGFRSSGGWSNQAKTDILTSASARLGHLEAAIQKLSACMPVALAPPNLPLPPIGNTIGAQVSVFELQLREQLATFLLRVARLPGVRIVQMPQLEAAVPIPDFRMELVAGFPYTLPFADSLANALVDVLCQPTPKKGLITDLDDTLWSGIVGEVGVAEVSWSQDSHTQPYGLYQQMLGHLAGCGVLLAACSKNEIVTVEAALARKDLLLESGAFFPVCANWGPKSASVARILRAWNVAADSVVFVDDSPMELDEVKQSYPGITCLRFNGKDPAGVWRLLGDLRNLFGKPVLTEEDRLRHASIRASAQIPEMGTDAASAEFLRTLQGRVTLAWHPDAVDKRPVELINKTNQFNLNGLRIGEAEWSALLKDAGALVAVVSYEDKFGPLGKVAVLVGSLLGSAVRVSHWVMSCRSFSRRLEHHTLDALFRRSGVDEIEFTFQATEKNHHLREFFHELGIAPDAAGVTRISRSAFLDRCGILPHQVSDLT